MNKSKTKNMTVILTLLILTVVTGCRKETTTNQNVQSTYWMNEVEKQDDALYRGVIMLAHDSTYNNFVSRRDKEYPDYNPRVGTSLVYQIERYKDDPNRTYHTFFCTIPATVFTKDFIDSINDKYELDLDMDEWEALCGDWEDGPENKYYYTLTAKEILALADSGVICYYVGSGEGNREDVEFDTLEGIYTFCELYGDQYIQYKK